MINSKSILLVEDDEIDQMTVERALTDLSVKTQLVPTRNGSEALEYLQNRNNKRPCLILLDWNMPRMNGQEFLTIIKSDEQLKKIPVVIHSTSGAREDINKGFELGAAGYMVKSNDYEKSKNTIRAIGRYWTLCEQPPNGE
ncbi:MAG: response regulator [Sedimentisphaerales bacterium]|nr:response regulator [Sedimentisphaerales bacterium]